ncbi:MAG TPA: hypothetical protein VN902_23025 [Candidatus Acidoferrales bacterium]|nr:hypothetical protein [Candidatus Acidoferrales bacterium]
MQKDERDLLDVLKFELEFLEKGGYGRSPREPWRPQFIFEDSPTCMNYDSKDHPDPCGECVLMQLVPPAGRETKIPCRHIPFNADGETLDSLYRYADQFETERLFGNWLRATIATLEEQRRTYLDNSSGLSAARPGESRGEPLFQSLHPKCANPACPTAFHWLGGGKFFRFRRDSAEANADHPTSQTGTAVLGVRHYWLCEHCSHVFTLVYNESEGVMLKLLWPELPVAELPKQLTTG